MKRIVGIALGLLATVTATAVYWNQTRFEPVPYTGAASKKLPKFSDRTIDFGIDAVHRQGDEYLTGLDETLGAGACAFDYDRDGWVDLFVANGSGDTRYYGQKHWWQGEVGHHLLKNDQGRRFVDVTKQAGLAVATVGMGCVTADLDNDGDTDVFVTNIGPNVLLRNNGDGTFTDVTATSGLQGSGWHTAVAVADVDGDGRTDLYVGGFIDFEKGSHTYEPGSQYKSDALPFFNSALYPALPNRLYRNLGDLRFEDVADAAGVANSDGRTLSALWSDLNEDRMPDLIVVNAAGTGSTTGFLNQGNWKFRPLGIQARIESGYSYRGISQLDADNDGIQELLLTGTAGNQTSLLMKKALAAGEEPGFTDEARQWGIARDQNAGLSPWSAVPGDFNNDGWTDIVLGNGQITPDIDTRHVTVGQIKQLLMNTGAAHFEEYAPDPRSPLLDRQSARGVAVADFNNDGRLDVYVAHNNDLGQLLVNEGDTEPRWIGIGLQDEKGNFDAIGAEVTVTSNAGSQTMRKTAGAGFLSGSDPRMHFGLGKDAVVRIDVRWPDGGTTTYRDVDAGRYVTLSRRNGLAHATENASSGMQVNMQAQSLMKRSAGLRKEYFTSLAGQSDDAVADEVMSMALQDPDVQVRRSVIKALAEDQDRGRLRYLARYLDDEDETVVSDAIDALCQYKEEHLVRYLLRMFSHQAALVRQHTADCFASYFREFESQKSVIHRKYLAMPYLISQIQDTDRKARLAAIRAVGYSERFRGVDPLMSLLADPDERVRLEAVRSLGMIREGYAIPALENLLKDTTQPPAIHAQLFIALKRLNSASHAGLLSDFVRGKGSFIALDMERRFTTILRIMEDEDGIVLNKPDLLALASATYADGRHDEQVAVLYTQILMKSTISDATARLPTLIRDDRARVRSAALLAGYVLQPDRRADHVKSALNDPDALVRQAMLKRLVEDRIPLPDALFIKALDQEDTRELAIRAMRRVSSDAVISRLRTWAHGPGVPTSTRVLALASLCESGIYPQSDDGTLATIDEGLLLARLDCELLRLPGIHVSKKPPAFIGKFLQTGSVAVKIRVFDFLVNREELWAKQEVDRLLTESGNGDLRRHVMQILPAGHLSSRGVLLGIAADRKDPLRIVALGKLDSMSDPNAIDLLRKIASDDSEQETVRMAAITALPAQYRRDMLPVVMQP